MGSALEGRTVASGAKFRFVDVLGESILSPSAEVEFSRTRGIPQSAVGALSLPGSAFAAGPAATEGNRQGFTAVASMAG